MPDLLTSINHIMSNLQHHMSHIQSCIGVTTLKVFCMSCIGIKTTFPVCISDHLREATSSVSSHSTRPESFASLWPQATIIPHGPVPRLPPYFPEPRSCIVIVTDSQFTFLRRKCIHDRDYCCSITNSLSDQG